MKDRARTPGARDEFRRLRRARRRRRRLGVVLIVGGVATAALGVGTYLNDHGDATVPPKVEPKTVVRTTTSTAATEPATTSTAATEPATTSTAATEPATTSTD